MAEGNGFMKYFSIMITLFFGLGLFAGCAPRWVRTPLVDERDITVSLEHKITDDQAVGQQYSHPFVIDEQDLRTLLSQLEYMAEPMIYGKPEQKPVFQAIELDRLVPALADALGKADVNQRVRFVSYNRGGGLLFKKRRRTSGVAFIRPDNRLNLAFADLNFEILTNEMENISRGDEYQDPLRIKSSFTPIVAPDYIEHVRTEKGKPYPTWIVVDLDGIPAPSATAAATAEAVSGKPAAPPAQPVPGSESQPGAGVESPPTTEAGAPTAQGADDWETHKQENMKKLEYLKELYDSGLIDDGEYKAQKEKLLDQL